MSRARLEAVPDIGGDVGGAKGCEVDRTGLAVEGPTLAGEELAHHPHVGAGEDVARRLAVVLDLAADDRVDLPAGGEHVLELVEDDEHPDAALAVQRGGKCQAVEERLLGRGVQADLRAGRNRSPARP